MDDLGGQLPRCRIIRHCHGECLIWLNLDRLKSQRELLDLSQQFLDHCIPRRLDDVRGFLCHRMIFATAPESWDDFCWDCDGDGDVDRHADLFLIVFRYDHKLIALYLHGQWCLLADQ